MRLVLVTQMAEYLGTNHALSRADGFLEDRVVLGRETRILISQLAVEMVVERVVSVASGDDKKSKEDVVVWSLSLRRPLAESLLYLTR